jgi:glycosyltransferase 2 family protein
MNKKKYWFGFAVSILFAFLFFRNVDFREIWIAFQSVNYIYTIPIMLIYLLSLWIRAVRWRYLLSPIKKVGLSSLFRATAIGFMANNILPARMGELVRAFILGDREKISKSASLATLVVERLFDGFTILLLFVMVLLLMPFPETGFSVLTPVRIKTLALFSFLFYVLVLVVLILLRFHNDRLNRVVGMVLKPFPSRVSHRILEVINSFVLGLDILRQKKDILIIKGYSLLLWVSLTFCVYLLFVGFGFHLTILQAFFLEVILIFGVSIPSAPGFIGTFHWACAAGLAFLGIEPNLAKTFSIILWLAYFVPTTLLGIVLLWQEGLSFRSIQDNRI